MPNTFKTREEAIAWRDEADRSSPRVGDLAPDFELGDVTGDQSVRLSDYREDRPVALIFGSFT